VADSGVALNVFGEEMGNGDSNATSKPAASARLIIDPIDGTEEFSRGIPTFGILLGIERDGEIVAGMASAPALGARWWAYRGEGAWRNARRIHVSKVEKLNAGMAFTGGTGQNKNREKIEKMRRLLD